MSAQTVPVEITVNAARPDQAKRYVESLMDRLIEDRVMSLVVHEPTGPVALAAEFGTLLRGGLGYEARLRVIERLLRAWPMSPEDRTQALVDLGLYDAEEALTDPPIS